MLMTKLEVIGDLMILWFVEDISWKNNSRKKKMINKMVENNHMILNNLNDKLLHKQKLYQKSLNII